MVDVPEQLYKYLHPSRIGILRNLLIRFSQASSLNDTLELRTPMKDVAERERLEGIVREKLAPSLWSQTSDKSRKTLERVSPGLADLAGEVFLQNYTNKAVEQIEQRYEQNSRKIFDVTDKNFGILSLTEVPNDIRMWGHYADGGRGFLIEFDPNHPWFHGKREERDSFRHIRQIKYVSSRPAKFLLDVTELDFLYTKWDAWRDEREWRIIRCFNDAKMIGDKRDPYGNDVILFAIPPDSIKSVILGFCAEPELEAEVCRILASNPMLNHIQVKRATQSVETGLVTIVSTPANSPTGI